ncbi:MAG: SHIRT domain-containing protein [Erysipelotrichaceae bacterium]|nr:SHIRT domain-containing protein [Erysipelotrichaceae bacterium]
MINRVLKIILCFVLILILVPMFSINPQALSDTTTRHSFYTNPANSNPELSMNDNGLEYFVRYSGLNTITNQIEYSSKNWDTSSNINIYSLVANNADVFDKEITSDLKIEGSFKNTTSNPISISMSVELPPQSLSVVDVSRITTDIISGNFTSETVVKVLFSKGNKLISEALQDTTFNWESVSAISISGKLNPNEEVNLSLPVNIVSNGNETMNLRVRSYSPLRKSTYVRMKLSKYMYTLSDLMYGVYAGAYRETINGVDTYKKIPAHIQKLMPTVQESDFVYNMFTTLYKNGQQADLTQASDKVAYDHSVFLIDTNRIFDAVKDEGYSVYADGIRGLWNSYAYYMGSNLVFTDNDGNAVNLGQTDAESGVDLSKFYVELHKVLDTKDITIYVGDAWNIYDNLIYRQSISDRGAGSHVLSDDEVLVTHNVNNMVPGEYWVKYSHQVDVDKFVSKTAKVIVLGKYSVNYVFESLTSGKELPEAVIKLINQSIADLENGNTVDALNPSVSEVIVEGGKWVFKGYDLSSITINNSNGTFVGKWEFVEDKVVVSPTPSSIPEPIKTVVNTDTDKKIVNNYKVPDTSSGNTYFINYLIIFSSIFVLINNKK